MSNYFIKILTTICLLTGLNVNGQVSVSNPGALKLNLTSCPEKNHRPFNVICYVALWYELAGFTSFNIKNLDPFLCTHIIGGYGEIRFVQEDSDVIIKFGEEDENRQLLLDSIVDMRRIHPSAEYVMSIGGYDDWHQAKYCKLTGSKLSEKFVTAVIAKVKRFRADGIEFLWNWPGRGNEDAASKFTDVKCLRTITKNLCAGMRAHGLLCMMTLRGLETYKTTSLDEHDEYLETIGEILRHADLINLWTDNLLDLNGEDGNFAQDFLRPDTLTQVTYSERVAALSDFSVNAVIEFYKMVVEKMTVGSYEEILEKIHMVISMQSRAYAVRPENFDLARALGPPDEYTDRHPLVDIESGYRWQYPFFRICRRLQGLSNEVLYLHEYKELGDLAFAYNFEFKDGSDGLMISTPTQKSVKEKVKFAKKAGLGGVMVFQIAADDVGGQCYNQSYPILNAIRRQAETCP